MGVEYPAEVLHVLPSAIPAIREEIATTLDGVVPLIEQMRKGAYLTKPWLGDPESASTMAYYNATVMDDANGPFQAAQKWVEQLQETDRALAASEAHYRAAEGDNAELWGRA